MLKFLYIDCKILGWSTDKKVQLDQKKYMKSKDQLPNYRDLFFNDWLLAEFLDYEKRQPTKQIGVN
tara:strand:- start:263 stop:460 length:198 start_codon:yes stop_codon:yes gene_type:complete